MISTLDETLYQKNVYQRVEIACSRPVMGGGTFFWLVYGTGSICYHFTGNKNVISDLQCTAVTSFNIPSWLFFPAERL